MRPKSFLRCAALLLTFCAVLVAPVILLYAAPLVVGIAGDLTQASPAPVAVTVIAIAAACLMLYTAPLRARIKILGRFLAVQRQPRGRVNVL